MLYEVITEAMTPEFREYQRQIVANAQAMARTIAARGFRLVSGGTDNHLMLVNLSATPLTGKDAEEALEAVGITVNKNTVPFETRSPFITSGIRIGTPARITSYNVCYTKLLRTHIAVMDHGRVIAVGRWLGSEREGTFEIVVVNVVDFVDGPEGPRARRYHFYDLVVGDEAWDADHFLHEHPRSYNFV